MKIELVKEVVMALCILISEIQPWVAETKFSIPKVLTKVTFNY